MPTNLENYGFGTQWSDFHMDRYEGYKPNMSDYHMHGYYEISLILSGDVKVLLTDTVQHGTEPRIVLTRPMTPHLIVCEPHLLYRRINLLFSNEFLADCVPEWKQLLGIFGKNGRVISLTEKQLNGYVTLMEELEKDTDPFRRRLRLMLLLSEIRDHLKCEDNHAEELPGYVAAALSYLHGHYAEKITAAELAWHLGISRTTLMTTFKKYTGSTLNEYLIGCRLKQAIKDLREGKPQETVAEKCGFGDACNLIRTFRRRFGMTPRQYIKTEAEPKPQGTSLHESS